MESQTGQSQTTQTGQNSQTPHVVSLTRNPNLSAPKIDRNGPNEVLAKFKDTWWTGLHPEKCPGFYKDAKTGMAYVQALPLLNLEVCTRQDVMDYFDNTWTLTEILFSGIKHESTYVRSPYHQLRHPKMFYYGHTAVLFLNKLRLAGLVEKPVDLYLEKILETGVDEMSWDDMSKNEMEWPSVAIVKDYRQKIYNIVKDVIMAHPDLDLETRRKNPSIKLNQHHPLWSLFMGFEHEKIHFETSSVLIRELPIDLVETPKYWSPLFPHFVKEKAQAPINKWVQVKGQTVTYGKNDSVPSFGWDNEFGQRSTQTKDFQVTQQLISNAEYYEFVSTGAYSEDQYWETEGLMWRKFRNTKRPTFWVSYGPEGLHDYKLRTIFEIIDMPWDWPAEVNYHEAKAYAHWKQEQDSKKSQNTNLKYRLITEAEFVTLRKNISQDPVLQKNVYSVESGQRLNYDHKFNFNYLYASASPVNSSEKICDVYDVMGNVWQWAEDQFNPLEQFKVHRLYDDFSTPCFDGKHQMILGGSFMSCGHEASVNARFHFRPHFFQHAGFRIAATLDGSDDNAAVRIKKTKDYVHQTRENVLDQMKKERWFEQVQQPLEMSLANIQSTYESTSQFVVNFEKNRASLPAKGSALEAQSNDVNQNFKWAYQTTKNFPALPESYDKLLSFIQNEVAPLGQQPGHPGYMAYVAGAANPLSAPAQVIALTLNQFTGHYSLSPGLVTLEMEVIRWFLTMCKITDANASGLLTSGGSQANMMALVAARNLKLKTSDLNQARFYASKQVHHCIGKALAFLGFPQESLNLISVDENFKMKSSELEAQINKDIQSGFTPVAVVGTAGSTNTGAVDALDEIAVICKKHQIWFHVDGAYGALFMLTSKGQEQLKGIDQADSVALDPHKALQIPYGVGCLLVRNKKYFETQFAGSSSYMPPSPGLENQAFDYEKVDFADMSPELSRDPRGLRVWLPIKTFGIGPFQLNLEEKLALSDELNIMLKAIAGVKIVAYPQLTIQAFSYKNSELTRKLLAYINQQGQLFLSGCEINGEFCIRVCLLGFRLHYQQVEQLIQTIKVGIDKIN